MLLVLVALKIVYLDLMRFIRLVALSCIYINVVLDGIISNLQCSVFCMKININMVLFCVITFILS